MARNIEREKTRELVLQRIFQAEKWRDAHYKSKWRHYYRMYRSEPESTRADGGSNLFVPITQMICEVVRTRISESLFASRPYVAVKARGAEDSERAEATEKLLDWQISDRLHFDRLLREEFLQNLCIFGTAVIFTGWKKLTRKTKRNITVNMPLQGYEDSGITFQMREAEEIEKIVYDDPEVVNIDIFDFYIDPSARSIGSARYCGHKEFRTKAEIKSFCKTAGWKVDWNEVSPVADIADSGLQIRAHETGTPVELDMSEMGDESMYVVHHYWTDKNHAVIIDNKYLALWEENPFWHGMKPYDACCYTKIANSFYGMGLCEIVDPLQSELNTSRNMRIDYSAAALRRMWKMRKGCGLTAKDLRWRQNGIIQVENMDDVQEINIQELPSSAFSIEEGIKTDMKDITGCHDIIMGQSAYDETATTTMTKDNNASLRFKDVVVAVTDDILLPVAEKCVALNQQFMNMDKAFRLLDEAAYITVQPDDVDGDFDLIYVGSAVEPMANNELEKQNALTAFQNLTNNPLYQQDNEATIALIDEMLKKLGFDDRERLLPRLPMMPADGMLPLAEEQAADAGMTPIMR